MSKKTKVEKPKAKGNILKTLTLEQRTELFFRICKTREELKAWIRLFLSLDLPDKTVSRYADTNPMDIVWLIYEICVLEKNYENIEELLCVAGRGSGKCQIAGTKILTQNGVRDIEDIVVGDIVYTGWGWDRVKATFNEGLKESINIKTALLSKETPFDNTGSPHHRIQAVLDDGSVGWKFLEDVSINDIIYKSDYSDFKVDTNSKKFVDGWIIGAILGDGTINRHNSNEICLCSSDTELLRFYADEVYVRFGIKQKVKRNSKKSINLKISSKEFKNWVHSYIEGELSYDKHLKTLNHEYDFLAGVVSGLMDTDGSADSITLANRKLIYQIGKILNIFGVCAAIDNSRREPRYSKFINEYVSYHECLYKTSLPHPLFPKFSKRDAFIAHAKSMNEQFRFPNKLLQPFAKFIKDELKASNGWITLNGDRVRMAVPYAKELYGKLSKVNSHIYGYKIAEIRDFFYFIGCIKQAEQLERVYNGYYETVIEVNKSTAHFYDLEMENIHSYWSNGFISHNTLAVAVAEFILLFHDQRDVAHVGAILSQAKRCYQYQQGFMLNERVKPILNQSLDGFPIMEKTTQEKSSFNVRDRKTGELVKVDLEVLPCTLKSVNGFHGAFVSVDEIDTVQGEGVRAFQDISGMLDSKRGRKSLRVGISTRKSRYGLMNQQIEDADIQGRTVKKWTVLEFSERCPDERSGTTPTIGYYLQDTMEVINEEQWLKKDPKKQEEYSKQEFAGENCLKCPMAALCLSDAKKQTSTSAMLKPISDAIKKTRENGADWAISQLYNLKPSVEGIVYKEFDEKEHVKDWNQMWWILTNQEYPGECTHDIFVKKCHSMGLACYAGIDWGWSNPSTITYFFVDKRENIYVVRCEGRTYTNNPTWVQIIKSKWHNMYRCQLYFPDLANPGDAQTMRTEGLPCPSEQTKDTPGGIQIVKKWLKSLASVNPKIFFAKETCGPIITEFGLYHFKTDAAGKITDDVEKEHDHWLDGLRYAMYHLFGKNSVIIADQEFDDKISLTDRMGNYSRMPSPEEFAASKSIRINPDAHRDISKLGQVGKKSDLDSEDESGVGGDGSFLWSF